MKFSDRIPIYVQVSDAIVKQIVVGELKAGEKIPGIKDLAKIFKINANTVVKVISELEGKGILETRRGLGTFMVEDEKIVDETINKYIRKRVEDVIDEFEVLGIGKTKLIEYIEEVIDGDNIKND